MNTSASSLAVAVAQLNPTVGDIAGNLDLARDALARARDLGADLVVFSELFITGYPPEDLVLKHSFQHAAMDAVSAFAKETEGSCAALMTAPWREHDQLYNSILLLEEGRTAAVRHKVHLPNYGVFDEVRVFAAGAMPEPVPFRGVNLGCLICEDMWETDVVRHLATRGAELLIVPNGSPYNSNKRGQRLGHAGARVNECRLPLVYVNQTGGQDELVFDGASFAMNADGAVALQMPAWQTAITLCRWTRSAGGWACEQGPLATVEEGNAAIYQAAMVGLKDYVNKNRFPGVVLGLSGGIDSALSAAMAVDALGASRVQCVMMPSKYTSQESLEDAKNCVDALGVRYDILPVTEGVTACEHMLAKPFANTQPDTTEENIQPRLRAIILMALSNKFGSMVLTTGNKSEMSVGYATLYGDMCGGYNALKDIYKTQVFELAEWRNANLPEGALGPRGRVIPQNIITKPPSAELRADQRDDQSLPPYDQLDQILLCLIEEEMAFDDIVARGFSPDVVARIEHLLYVAEYKRRQAPPGVKIGTKNFGRDRRYPITNGFRDARRKK